MMSPISIQRPFAAAAVALALGVAPGLASAQKGGDQARDRTQDHLQTRDQDRLQTPDQDRERARDQDRVHQDATTADATQDRLQMHLRDMDRTRDRIHQETNAARRNELRNQYRAQIEQGLEALQARQGAGPMATDQQRLRHMEQQMEQMQRMMRHSWEYQAQEGMQGAQ